MVPMNVDIHRQVVAIKLHGPGRVLCGFAENDEPEVLSAKANIAFSFRDDVVISKRDISHAIESLFTEDGGEKMEACFDLFLCKVT